VSESLPVREGRLRVSGGRSCDVRQHLRSATAQAHASLHEHPAFVALVEGNATVELYRSLLGRLYGIHRPLEVALAGAGHHLPSGLRPAHRSRAALMVQDVVALGLDALSPGCRPKAMSCRRPRAARRSVRSTWCRARPSAVR
jgi:heme oxygenase